jgi:hypothetical protein
MSSLTSTLGSLQIAVDTELAKVCDIAAHVGDMSGDDVNISYTSLLIGLLWSDDSTSKWLQAEQQRHGIRVDDIYANRNHPERSRDMILERVATGVGYAARQDVVSVSARTILQEANTIAHETDLLSSEPIGTRHLAAAYFFRNPPGHDRQLHIDWGFDTDAWRRAFAQFIGQQYAPEAPKWSQLLSGYLPTEEVPTSMPGTVLGGFTFESSAIAVLRSVESAAATTTPSVLTSELLLRTIAAARSDPDCASFAEQAATRLGITNVVTLASAASPFDPQGSTHGLSRGLKNILDRSRTLTRSITGSELIGVRHIIASMLVAPDSTANRQLIRAGVSIPLLRQKLLRDYSKRWVNDDGVQWRFQLVGLTPPTVSAFNADSADRGEDKLDVARYATAFAVVLAADAVTPPLSIGVFGDWGSGKSFFMRLMQEQTQKIASSGAVDAAGQRLFCRRVLSIKFNAWHYVDRNLWATLVQTIFQSLRAALVRDTGDSDLMDRVIASLEVTQIARKEAEERVQQARAAATESAQRLEATRQDLAAKSGAINTVTNADVITVLRDTVVTDVRVEHARTLVESYLGLSDAGRVLADAKKTTGQLMDVVHDARIVAARSRSTFEWLARAPVKRRDLLTLGGVSLAVLVAGFVIAITYRTEINAAWPLISSAFIEGGTVVALVAAWARRHLTTISAGLDQVDTVRTELDARVAKQRATANQQLASAEAEHRTALDRVAHAQAELKVAQNAVCKAERDAQESRSAHRIAQLVEQRISGKQYEQYLGLVDAVRRDFQTLTDLMKALRREQPTEGGDGILPIERIVLYIDDLDRCPSDKVVSVLEAIHLLLAFELFVVVVGIDVRWAARSLAEQYPNHLSPGRYEGSTGQTMEEEGASALDYLEKIFQIPFWLPPMDEQASRNMIADLVPRPKTDTAAEVEKTAAPADASQMPSSSDGGANAEPADQPGAATTSTGRAEPLLIESEERSFMLSLAEAVGKSPRRLKRFVNTYRILKGSIDALARETFVVDGGRSGDYRAAMTLLGLVTGAPRSSLPVLQRLAEQSDEQKLDAFITAVETLPVGDERSYANAALRAYQVAIADQQATVRDLRQWIPEVTRFSFRSGRW